MRLQDFTSSKPVTRFGLFMARNFPEAGIQLTKFGADVIARRKPEIYWSVYNNLRHIIGPKADEDSLHTKTHQVFLHAGKTYVDFFRAASKRLEELAQTVWIDSEFIANIRSETAAGRGVLLLGTHVSNFDLGIMALGAHGLPIQMLTLANPQAGFHIFNQLRAKTGFEVTPITPQSLRAAIRRLKDGGIVMTAVDRPVHDDRHLVEFFGHPAYLPLGPMRLALMTGATVMAGSFSWDQDEGYSLENTPPIEIVRTGNRKKDIFANTKRLLNIVEGFVRAHPEQWMMFHPVWQELEGA